jgi:hypothetical protein
MRELPKINIAYPLHKLWGIKSTLPSPEGRKKRFAHGMVLTV